MFSVSLKTNKRLNINVLFDVWCIFAEKPLFFQMFGIESF